MWDAPAGEGKTRAESVESGWNRRRRPRPAEAMGGIASDVGALIERCVAGDDEAQARFYTRYSTLVERAICQRLARVTGSAPAASDVEDIGHEVFERLLGDNCSRLKCLKKPQAIDAWLMTVAANHAMDHVRQRTRQMRLHASAAAEAQNVCCGSPADHAIARERNLRVAEGLSELPSGDRLVLDLFFVQGLKYAEIADVLGLNINTVSARLRRAKAKLRHLLEENGDAFS